MSFKINLPKNSEGDIDLDELLANAGGTDKFVKKLAEYTDSRFQNLSKPISPFEFIQEGINAIEPKTAEELVLTTYMLTAWFLDVTGLLDEKRLKGIFKRNN